MGLQCIVSRRIKCIRKDQEFSIASETLCFTRRYFHIQYHVCLKIFKWKIVSEYLFFRNLYKHKNNTVKNSFLYAFGFCLLKSKRISWGICLSTSIFSPAYEMTGYTKCPNINFWWHVCVFICQPSVNFLVFY